MDSQNIGAMLQDITARLQALERQNTAGEADMSQDGTVTEPPDEVSWDSILPTNTVEPSDVAGCELAMLCGVPPPWAKSEKH